MGRDQNQQLWRSFRATPDDKVLGVTESRVSQLHTKAKLRLKARLSGTAQRVEAEA